MPVTAEESATWASDCAELSWFVTGRPPIMAWRRRALASCARPASVLASSSSTGTSLDRSPASSINCWARCSRPLADWRREWASFFFDDIVCVSCLAFCAKLSNWAVPLPLREFWMACRVLAALARAPCTDSRASLMSNLAVFSSCKAWASICWARFIMADEASLATAALRCAASAAACSMAIAPRSWYSALCAFWASAWTCAARESNTRRLATWRSTAGLRLSTIACARTRRFLALVATLRSSAAAADSTLAQWPNLFAFVISLRDCRAVTVSRAARERSRTTSCS
mmetsp:Transcript_12712/g.29223  ORF Transcript_12712/g.29223 Transcript_12712/m.29223 type:complete len:287 (+) Transcript_12712:327-1187(+)